MRVGFILVLQQHHHHNRPPPPHPIPPSNYDACLVCVIYSITCQYHSMVECVHISVFAGCLGGGGGGGGWFSGVGGTGGGWGVYLND